MPIPSLITDLSTTVASNSPAGSDNVFPDLDNYLRALSAFLASIRDNSGNGWVSPYVTPAVLTTTLASPPAIGGTARQAGSFTSLTGTVVTSQPTSAGSGVMSIGASGTGQGCFFSLYNNTITPLQLRWQVVKDSAAESATAEGSDFSINSYDNTGAYIATPITIKRSTGVVQFSAAPTGTGITNLFASPPAIGGTAAAAGTFTTLVATTGTGIATLNASNLSTGTVPAARITSVTATGAVMSTQSGSAPSYAARAWGNVTSGGTLNAGGNVSSAKTSTGVYTITFTTPMADANYAAIATMVDGASNTRSITCDSLAAGSFVVRTLNASGAAADFPFTFTVVK